jgi:hypothetical protein
LTATAELATGETLKTSYGLSASYDV